MTTRLRWVGFALCLALCACGSKSDSPNAQGTGGDAALGSGGTALNGSGGASGTGGVSAGSGGATVLGGGGARAGTGGANSGTGHTAGSGGANAGDKDGGAMAAGDSGAVGAGSCTRDFLKGVIDEYFTALAAHDAATLPQASTLRFTENTKELELGMGLVWKTAGAVKFTRSALDTERCGSVTEAVIPNSGTDTIFGLRLQFAHQQITEVETIVVDPDSGFFPMPNGIVNSKSDAWDELVPAEQRSTREELEAAGKAYFAAFGDSSTKVPYAMPCDRLENGFQTTQGDCSNFGSAGGINQPEQHYPITDLEAGISVGFILFAGADIDFHMFKVIDHEIRWINAVVGPQSTSRGW